MGQIEFVRARARAGGRRRPPGVSARALAACSTSPAQQGHRASLVGPVARGRSSKLPGLVLVCLVPIRLPEEVADKYARDPKGGRHPAPRHERALVAPIRVQIQDLRGRVRPDVRATPPPAHFPDALFGNLGTPPQLPPRRFPLSETSGGRKPRRRPASEKQTRSTWRRAHAPPRERTDVNVGQFQKSANSGFRRIRITSVRCLFRHANQQNNKHTRALAACATWLESARRPRHH